MNAQEADELLELLRDGEWHKTNEAISKSKIKETKAKLLTSFLKEFGFIEQDKEGKRIRIDALTRKFIQRLETADLASGYEEMTACKPS